MNSPSFQKGLEWISAFIGLQQSTTQRYRVQTSLRKYQAAYELHHPGRCFVEALNRTDFIKVWLETGRQREEWLRSWHTSMRGFGGWLFNHQLIDTNVMIYVMRKDVLERSVPLLRLERSLQPAIVRFQKTFRSRCDRHTVAAHRWNLYRNQPECQKWTCPEEEEECWRGWLAQLAQAPESAIWRRDLIRALEHFFDFLVEDGLLAVNHLSSFLRLHRARIQIVQAPGGLDLAAIPGRADYVLPDWMKAYLEHLQNRGRRAGTGSFTLSNLRTLQRVLEGRNIVGPEQIDADVIQAYLEVNEGQVPRPLKGSTRRLRLITLRGLCRFLVRRDIQAPLRLVERWARAHRSLFHPHIYSLNELSQILCAFSRRAEDSPVPLVWKGLETIVFLLYACGLRSGEALRLRQGEVDLERGLLLVTETKFYKERWIPLGAEAGRRLAEYLKLRQCHFPTLLGPQELVFISSRGHAFSSSVLRMLFRQTVDRLDIASRGTDRPRIHDLRHTMAVHRLYKWYSDGAEVQNKLPLLAAYLGHANYNNTQVYLHLAEDLIRQAGRNFQQAFEQVVGRVAREASDS